MIRQIFFARILLVCLNLNLMWVVPTLLTVKKVPIPFTNTGNVFPATGENLDRAGNSDWVNPGRVTADDNSSVSITGVAGSDYLIARNFSFSIPSTATIRGITVRIEAAESSGGTESLNAQLQNDAAALFGSSKANTINGTGMAVYTYGSVSDLWGASITPAIVNDPDFGVRFWFTTAHNMTVDYVTVSIEYIVSTTNFFQFFKK